MKIPPKKPHFFKPILPDFNNGLKIPIGFLKYLKGQEHVKCAVLKRDGKKWRVKVNGRKLEEGNWGKFVKEFDLQVGNILVFSHEGNMEFEISIFDSSQCSREYAEYMQEDVVEDEVEVDEEEEEEEYEEEDEEDEYVVEEEEEEEEDEYEQEEDEVEEEEEEEVVTDDNSCERSYFEYTITPYCLSFRACLFLPQQFALANGLTNKKCKLIIRDERQRSWKLKICSSSNPRPRAYIGSGWRKFIAENSIKEGDRIKFEVVTNGKTPIWKFQVDTDYQTPMRKFQETPSLNIDLSNKTSSLAEAASTNKAFVQSHFECTIRQYCFLRGTLNVPKQFAIANGLTNKKCELIVRDERQRSWNLKLSSGSTRSYIGDGFRKFIADNCLKEGDDIMFEVITNGEAPIWKFKVVTGGETAVRKFQEKLSPNIDLPNMTSSHAEADTNKPFVRSHFVCTITQKMFSRGLLYVPKKFAIANGLTNKKCGLIVRDERQRSWNLKLSFGGTQAQPYIGYGLRKLIAENCTKEGDRIKFEVVTNGKTPIWRFQVFTDGEIPMKTFQERPSPSIKLSNKTSSHAEAATNKPFVQSHFECTIREYCLSRGLLYLPKQFAFANCLINKKHDLIIRDERQKSWNLKLCYCQTDVYIGDGWRKFVADKFLKEGDRIMFEVVTNGETPVWEFRVNEAKTPLQKYQDIMKKPSNTSPLNAQVSTSTSGDDDHPYFISTIKRYCIRKTELYFPLEFAKSNGLNRKCEMILKDETERCWSVWLGRLGTHFGITRGWTKFRTENGLQVGDAYKFELINNGEIPIAHFHCKYSAKVAKRKKQ